MPDGGGTRPILWAGMGVASLVVLVSVFVLWRAIGGAEPDEVALGNIRPPADTQPSANGDVGDPGAVPTSFDGTWTIDTSSGSVEDGSASFAGYRIEEELGGVGTHTAVGRTTGVQGTMTIFGTSVTDLSVTADMTTLTSDDEQRDSQLATRGLETGRFPTATFILTEPITLDEIPAPGVSIDATATGELTLHGVTQQVDVSVDAQWTGEHIEVAASLDVALADYQIEPPTGFLVLSIADTGTLELHLLFTKA